MDTKPRVSIICLAIFTLILYPPQSQNCPNCKHVRFVTPVHRKENKQQQQQQKKKKKKKKHFQNNFRTFCHP